MFHYRDSKTGKFYKNNEDLVLEFFGAEPAFLRFARMRGAARDLWSAEGETAASLLARLQLDWKVNVRDVLVAVGHDNRRRETPVPGYRALVRPDTERVMSVVSTSYSVAENGLVALALEDLCRRLGEERPLVAAASFGRQCERTLFAGRVARDDMRALCLIAYNTHGGEGAVRFQLVEAMKNGGAVCVLDSDHASLSIPHVGDVEHRLAEISSPFEDETFIERYLSETEPLWQKLMAAEWTPSRTADLIKALWGETPALTRSTLDGATLSIGGEPARHPGHHLPHAMQSVKDAASAYVAICDWIDNHSEACERGDFTKDRDERLALGAGNTYKRRAWRWLIDRS